MILVADVLEAMSDNRSLELFRTIALTRTDSDTLISKTKLTCKQYYSRMSRLMNAGLIKRKNGKHTLTAFGKVIYDITLVTIENAINYYWKLKAIESLAMSNDLPAEELERVIDNFIDNQEIKAVLVSDNKFDSQPYAAESQQKHLRQIKPELLVH
jgi:predicted transcriptional regulator